jgi:DNA-binding GntR family transcriptional regulator
MVLAAPARRPADTARRVYDRLRALVIDYQIRPAQRLNEVELARRLGVSRTPLREALARLAIEGFLSFEPNRGYSRRPLESREAYELYELRRTIEIAGLGLAVDRAGDDEIAALGRFWREAMTRPSGVGGLGDSAAELVRLDEQFHERLLALSGNAEAVRLLAGINARIHFVRWIDLDRAERRQATYDEHGALLEALAARDGPRAIDLLSRHIERRMEQIVEVIREGAARLAAE